MKPPSIPDHTLLRPIGRGAYGEVWLARNVMGALRAVKIIWRGQFESQRPYDREFEGIQRYEPVSRSSGGLVHVLHVGRKEAEGYFYYVMELADSVISDQGSVIREPSAGQPAPSGVPLITDSLITDSLITDYSPRTLRSDLKRLGRLPTADCLRLALDVTSGLAQLHRRGLVHRDVKPGNIIYVQGRAKLADIGLVSAGGECRTFVGTEGYIPPEGPGSPAADLYALGIALYEASTGHSPEKFPDVPAEWFAHDTGSEALEFHEIILQACEGQRERRYKSAEAMQADLALLQSGQSVRRMRALERRYARLRLSGIVGTLLLVCALVAVFFANYRARLAAESREKEARLREQAQNSLARAESAESDARQQLFTALLEQARGTVHSGEMGQRVRALDAIRRAAAISNTVELRRAAFAALALPDLRFVRDVPATKGLLTALDPAFERFATTEGRGPVEVRSLADQRLLASLPAVTNLEAYLLTWSPDGRFLAFKREWSVPGAYGNRADLEVWDLNPTRRVVHARDQIGYNALSFHPRLPRLMAGRTDGQVAVLDLHTGETIRQFTVEAELRSLSFAPDGERFAAASGIRNTPVVATHEANSGRLLSTNVWQAQIENLAWHPDGRWIAVPDESGNVRLIEPDTGQARTLGRHKGPAVDVAFSPDGDFLISGGWEMELICWDLRTMRRAFTIGVNAWISRFRNDGRQCVIHPPFDRVQIYDFEFPSACREFPDDLGRDVAFGAFSQDGRWLAAIGDQSMGVWDLQTRGPAAIVPKSDTSRIPFFTPTEAELYTCGSESFARWRVTPGPDGAAPQLAKRPLLVPPGIRTASIVSNQLVMACLDAVGFMPLGNVDTTKVRFFSETGGWRGQPSPDGRWLGVVGRWPSPLLRIHLLPEVELITLLTNRAFVCDFAFSPRGDELMVATQTGLKCYDTSTWARTRELAVPCERLSKIIFAPDGESFWLASDSRTAALRNTRTLEVLLPLPSGLTPLALSADGRRLAVSVDMRRVQVWDLAEVRERFRELGLDWRELP